MTNERWSVYISDDPGHHQIHFGTERTRQCKSRHGCYSKTLGTSSFNVHRKPFIHVKNYIELYNHREAELEIIEFELEAPKLNYGAM